MQRQVMVALSLTLAACDGEVPTPPPIDHSAHVASAALGPSDLATLRQVTAPFHNFKQAKKAGWNAQITSCFSSAEGGMGFHYGNPGLIDGTVAVNQPELLLYEPQKNGQLRLVAVEYIVPRQAWPGPGLPSLFGQTFSENEAFDLYTLHVWVWHQNATGLFRDWNPEISCQFADQVDVD